ncbi:MAG: M24 family metallopeptidase [Rickettsiales bacterium]|nr:M24 family metallopeptidase [Rickettsiales bacterium]
MKDVFKSRSNSLKKLLGTNKIDYFILPNSDEFFSEYLPQNEKRIEFISGFNGSSATIIFTQKKSYFFTDGRYVLQAKKQLDKREFEIINIAEKSVLSWLKENLDKKTTLGIDPKLSSLNFVKSLKRLDSKIIFLEKNPIDEIWKDRPEVIRSKVFSCGKKIVGIDSIAKRKKVLEGFESDAMILTKPENLCWLLNIRAADIEFNPLLLAYGILFRNGDVELFIDKKRLNKNLEQVKIIGVDSFFQRIESLKIKKVEIDPNATNYWIYSLLEKNNFSIIEKNSAIDLLKSQKNSTEINGAIKSHEADGLAVTKFLFWLENSLKNKKKIDEISAAKKLLEFRKNNSAFLYESFAAISGFGANGAVIHYHSNKETNKKITLFQPPLKKEVAEARSAKPEDLNSPFQSGSDGGSLYLIDSGGQYFGEDFCGTTDITRTISIGTPNKEIIENFTRVLKGHIALAHAKFPINTSGAQLDALARNHLWQAGLNYDHGTGHGVGSFLSVHEGPCGISKNAHQTLLAGMILSNEPGFYKEGEYGIRIENLMLVKKFNEKFLQFETLTLAPIDHRLIDFKMMTYPEKKWLKEYHQRIFDVLKSGLSKDEKQWLGKITTFYKNIM